MPKLPGKVTRVKRFPGRIGQSPSSSFQGRPAVMAANNMRLWSHNRTIFSSNCNPPDLWGLETSSVMTYYIPTRCQSRPSGNTHRLYGEILQWGDNRSAQGTISWYPSYVPGTPGASVTLYDKYHTALDQTYGSRIDDVDGNLINLNSLNFYAFDNDSNEFELGMLKIENILPAAMHIATSAPEGAIGDANWRPLAEGCSAGSALRGYSPSHKYRGIGELLHRTCTADYNTDYVTSALAAPVFSWGHHHGVWVGADAVLTETRNLFGDGATLRFRAHSPFQDATIELRPVIVYSSGVETGCTITSTAGGSGSSSVTLSVSANPALEDFSGATGTLAATVGASSEVTVEVTIPVTSDTANWIIIHSIALWPVNEAYGGEA